MTIKGLKMKVHQACPKFSIEKDGPTGEPEECFSEASWLKLFYKDKLAFVLFRTGKDLDVLGVDDIGEVMPSISDTSKVFPVLGEFEREMKPA